MVSSLQLREEMMLEIVPVEDKVRSGGDWVV